MTRSPKDDADLVGTTPLGVYRVANGLPRFELHVFLGDGVEVHVLPPVGSVTIGRSHGVEIRVDDASVSRKHALLHVGSALLVQDLGSQNGTRVGNTLLAPRENTPVVADVPFIVGGVTVVVRPIEAAVGEAVAGVASQTAPRALLRDDLASVERARIIDALAQCGGNQTKAALVLGISRRTLVSRLADFGIPRPRK